MNTTAAITVTIINRGVGTPQAHRAGCADLAKDARGASIWDVANVTSLQDIVEDLAADFIDEDPDTTWEDFEHEVRLMHCVGTLPRSRKTAEATAANTDTEIQLPAPTSRKNSKQAEIILTFLAAHAGTAYTPHQIGVAMGHKGLRDACARLAAQGVLIKASDKPVSYKIAG